MNRKKAREKDWIEQFCGLVHLCVQQIECDDKQESPDAFVVLRQKRRRVKVGVEVTMYHSDVSSKKGSPARELYSNWLKIERLLLDLARNHPQLRGVLVTVRLKRPAHLPAGHEARALAEKLVRLAASMVPQGSWKKEVAKAPFPQPYESVGKCVRAIALACIGLPDWLHWDLPNAGSFGLFPARVKAILREKEDAPYDWEDAQERWLLIVAGSEPAVLKTWGAPGPEYVSDMTELRSGLFHRVLLLDASSTYARELYRTPGLSPLAAN